jgi:hypothetical protein
VKQISAVIEQSKQAATEEERVVHNATVKELFRKMLYRVQMQGEISTELGLRINATQRELGSERGHWESGRLLFPLTLSRVVTPSSCPSDLFLFRFSRLHATPPSGWCEWKDRDMSPQSVRIDTICTSPRPTGAFVKREAEANYKLVNPDPPPVVSPKMEREQQRETYAKHPILEEASGSAKKVQPPLFRSL